MATTVSTTTTVIRNGFTSHRGHSTRSTQGSSSNVPHAQKYVQPGILLAAVLAAVGAGTAGYFRGAHNTRQSIQNDMLKEEQLGQQMYQKMLLAVGEKIGEIQIVNKTITQELEREVRVEKVYSECRNTDAVVGLLNAILSGQAPAESFGPDQLPGTDTADR